ncbi:MAG: DUF3500 domain-containing protein [Planctomycetota bacterium]
MLQYRKHQFGICVLAALASVGIAAVVISQPPQRGRGQGGRGPGRGAGNADQPFVGVLTSQGKEEGLFSIESTGVSTKPVVDATKDFLAKLNDEQVLKTMFPVKDKEWRLWDNRHFYKRQGVGFDEMSKEQREAAFAMIEASLSAKGLKKTKDIMKLNGTLAELANNFEEYGEWLYWITIMGEPSEKKPWGWQLDGHHVVINYFVLGDQVVMSPVFMGSEPVEAKDGKFKGTIVMQDEQNKGLAFMQSLSPELQGQAILMKDKSRNNNLSEAYKDNIQLDYAGLKCSELNAKQRELFLSLVKEYVGNMDDGHAKVKMAEVEKHLDKTYFAWIGGATAESVYYYRVYSPVILIEFDHQRRVAPFRSQTPMREHIHTVVRTPNGNDYGKDLLRQHYEAHSHD